MNGKHVLLSLLISGFIIFGGCFSLVMVDQPDGESGSATQANEMNQSERNLVNTTGAVDPDNPYQKETLVVAVNDSEANSERLGVVTEALEYWEGNSSEEYAGYPIEYDLQPNATNPDVKITWVAEVEYCSQSNKTDFVGCADLVVDNAPETATIHVETGYLRNGTLEVLKHEIGHTLGLEHDDEPQQVMSFGTNVTPRETHIDVQIVWKSDNHDREKVRGQVRNTLEYYESWTQQNMKTNLTYDLRDSEARKQGEDIYIEVSDDRNFCDTNESSSCVDYNETNSSIYPQYTVSLADLEEDEVGWYSGYYVGYYLSLEPGELPKPLQNNNRDHVTGNWWET